MFLKKISWQKPFNFTARPIKLKIMMSSLIWYPTCNFNSHSFEVIFNFQYLKNAVSHMELPYIAITPVPMCSRAKWVLQKKIAQVVDERSIVPDQILMACYNETFSLNFYFNDS